MRIAMTFSNPLPRTFAFLAHVVPPVLRWGALIFFCLFVGASLALIGTFAAIAWLVLGCGLLLPLFMQQENRAMRDWSIYFFLTYVTLLPIGIKMSGVIAVMGPPQAVVFIVGLLGLPALLAYSAHSRQLVLAMIALGLFLALGLLSSQFGRSRSFAAAYQFLSDLKPLLMLGAGFLAVWSLAGRAVC